MVAASLRGVSQDARLAATAIALVIGVRTVAELGNGNCKQPIAGFCSEEQPVGHGLRGRSTTSRSKRWPTRREGAIKNENNEKDHHHRSLDADYDAGELRYGPATSRFGYPRVANGHQEYRVERNMGAIAYSEVNGKHGFFWGADKRLEAEQSAPEGG